MPREYFSFGSGVVMNGSSVYGVDFVGGTYSGGMIRLANNQLVVGRNNAGTADVELFRIATSDALTFGGVSGATTTILGGPTTMSWSHTYTDGVNVTFQTTNGTRLGTATGQKIGFWNAVPVAQYSTTGTTTGFTAVSGTAALSGSTYTGGVSSTAYNVADIVRALKLCGIILA
jgi:hypothetical protein